MQNFEPIFANDGYRPNVGIIICNNQGQLFWARRVNQDGWQFPQGGVSRNESLVEAMYRELQEETGLQKEQVRLVAHTKEWLRYDLPRRLLRNQRRRAQSTGRRRVNFRGQKQVWFLIELIEDDSVVDLAAGLETPEFDSWRWVDMHHAIDNIVEFKKTVYQRALSELHEFLPTNN
ncbi:RNA pyrophosphohydrolase [Arenicella xantha]|uniref:RNA pyrophosphohydrolase n=1 Tax=Arenicella xantha TaxID=644221 RepID=A0A395JIE5_9GAMM|nr:RNA pyrophosphohydrolase [Arenicella xantha]RBP49846.1 putative (di)nucleoside polyphosphate hydrolase [Arenicella xantha]